MNRTTNLFVLLIVISFILPSTAIRYAQAATENSQDSSNTGSGQESGSSNTGSGQESGSSNTGSGQESGSSNTGSGQESGSSNTGSGQESGSSNTGSGQESGSSNTGSGQESGSSNTGSGQESGSSNTGSGQESGSSNTGSGQESGSSNTGSGQESGSSNTGSGQESSSTGNEQQQSSSSTGNGEQSNNTRNAQLPELPNSILAVQNRERAAVGVPPLVWSDKLAADAKTYAEHLIATGPPYNHPSAEWVAAHPTVLEGENLVVRAPPEPFTQELLAQFQQFWVGEKKDYQGEPGDFHGVGHYTQMVWRDTKEVGCATATGNGHDVLVCRYSPPGNVIGQKPYSNRSWKCTGSRVTVLEVYRSRVTLLEVYRAE